MRRYKSILIIAVALVAFLGFESCSPASGDNPGHEYMPDMGHSVAYEANVINEYYQNTWDVDSENQSGFTVEELSRRNQPVQGTMPRGYAGIV
ncbi:MAG: cytochrome c, partial [Saprospiraceae bacterium]